MREELADLRAWLSLKLGPIKREPGPEGLTTLGMVSDGEIIAKIEKLTEEQG